MSLFPPVTRPNGKVYHPRSYRFTHGEGGPNDSIFWCLVLGTHDLEVARGIAEREVKAVTGDEIALGAGITGWWRESISKGEPYWTWDEIRGAAGVLFTEES